MDEELGVPAHAIDVATFERLLRANALSMLRFADFVLHDRSAAEDAVQEAFMIAWKQQQALRDTSAFTPWLRTIVLRQCLRWRRRLLRQVLGISDAVVAPRAPDASLQVDVQRAVRSLSAGQRAVIYLRFYEGQTLGQVAAVLRIPESTVKTRLYDALGRLRQKLPDYSPNAGERA
jgi:RNA polymerase sigma-70 factor (ECF subfamily)